MNVVKVKSYAKLNLTLEILGVEKGYHLLDSLVTSVDIYDLIVLKKRKDKFSRVVMHGMNSESIPPEKNNALKAAERFSDRFGTFGADITVYKNIPIGAGLGGSSADISGVINGMAKLYGVTDFAALKTLGLLRLSFLYPDLSSWRVRAGRSLNTCLPLPCRFRLALVYIFPSFFPKPSPNTFDRRLENTLP